MDKVSMSHLISFSIYQTKCVVKFLFRQLIMSDSKIFLKSTSKAVADREKKSGRTQKCEYLKNEKNFLDKMKNIFH